MGTTIMTPVKRLPEMRSGEKSKLTGTEANSGWSAWPSYLSDSWRSAPAEIASTMSLIVTPRCLPVSLTSASASVAVANLRCASTRWFMNDGGGVNGRVSSGDSFRELLRTRRTPCAV